MMALSTRKTNLIIADWKTGKYPSAYALSKAHKVSDKTISKIINGIPQSNADVVEVCVLAEHAKNSVKNTIEKKAVEIAVQERLEYADLFENSAVRNQKIANTALDAVEHMQTNAKDKEEKGAIAITSMGMLKDHSAITAKNKDVVMGKDVETQVNVQTNVQNNISVAWE